MNPADPTPRPPYQLERRTFMAMIAGGLLAAPLAAEGQQAGKVYRIGHILLSDDDLTPFVQGLSSLGWVEGKNIVFEHRQVGSYAGVKPAAEEFVRIKIDVIVCVGAGMAGLIQQVTRTIPIVTLSAGELGSSGLVASLARPGGNVTGMQQYNPELMGKRIQILKELLPTLSRIAVLRRGRWHPGILAIYQQATKDAAQKLGIRVRDVEFQNPDELPDLFAGMVKERDAALLIWSDPAIGLVRRQIIDPAVKHRRPSMAEHRDWSANGALMSYGAKRDEVYRQAATHVDQILKGAKPGDLPIGQPTTFEFLVNLKTAKALGLTIPPSLLARADQIIE